jgi:hypothetical protein
LNSPNRISFTDRDRFRFRKGRAFSPALSLAILAALAALAAGCGGSSHEARIYSVEADTTMTTASTAKARYVPRINRICRKVWPVIFRNWTEYVRSTDRGKNESPRERFAGAARTPLIAGVTYYIFDRIHTIGAPPGDKREVEKIIGAMQSASERGEKKLVPVNTIAQVAELYGKYNRLARAYGFDDCLVNEARLGSLSA